MLDSMLVRVELLVRWDVLRHSKRSVMFANSEKKNERLVGQTKLRQYSPNPRP